MGEEPTESIRGDFAGIPEGTPAGVPGGSGYVTTKVAAEALGVNLRTVRAYIERGDLVAKAEGEGIQKTYLVSIDSLYALRDRRGYPRHSRAQTRDRPASPEASAAVSGGDLTDIIRDLTSELVQWYQESAELRTRLELTAEAESTLREQLEREREETRRLREELEAKRSKGFWRSCSGADQQLHLYAGCG